MISLFSTFLLTSLVIFSPTVLETIYMIMSLQLSYCVSKLIQSTSCGYRFSIYKITTRYVILHSSPRTYMVLGIVFWLAIPDWAAAFFPIKRSLPFFDLLSFLFYIKSAWESTTEKDPEPNAQNLVPSLFLHLRCDFRPVSESKDYPAIWIDRSVID